MSFADDVRFGAGMREDVQEVIDDHREVGVVNPLDVVDQLAARLGAHQFVEGVFVVLAAGGHQPLQKLFFVLVFASLLVVVEPLVGHQLVDGQRHQSREYGVAGVLGGRGQDSAVEIVLRHVVIASQQRGDRPPLVVAEVVDQQQRGLGILVCHREDLRPHERMRHDRGWFRHAC